MLQRRLASLDSGLVRLELGLFDIGLDALGFRLDLGLDVGFLTLIYTLSI